VSIERIDLPSPETDRLSALPAHRSLAKPPLDYSGGVNLFIMPKTAFVAGGAGFLGSHLCDRLLKEGYGVIAADNLVTGDLDNIAHLRNESEFEFRNIDVCDPIVVERDLDVVFHLASPASPEDYLLLPIETLRAGSYATHNLLDLARAHKARFFLASTSEVYGDPDVHPQTEEYWGRVNPNGTRSCYDEAKRYAEAATFAYHRTYAVDIKVVRIFNTYGPRMRVNDGRVVPAFLSQALTGKPLTLYGNGMQTRSFCYVSDLIDGIYRLSVSDQTGPINIGNPIEKTMIELAAEINRLTGAHVEVTHVPMKTADDPKQRCPDISKAKALLDWSPLVGLEEGLLNTIPYFRRKLGL
jgi:dTDP-glucose 4,6-dehydratase